MSEIVPMPKEEVEDIRKMLVTLVKENCEYRKLLLNKTWECLELKIKYGVKDEIKPIV